MTSAVVARRTVSQAGRRSTCIQMVDQEASRQEGEKSTPENNIYKAMFRELQLIYMSLEQWFSSGFYLPPGNIWQYPVTFGIVATQGMGAMNVHWKEPVLLLNILQYTDSPKEQKELSHSPRRQ